MSNHVGSQVGALSYPVSPKRGDSHLIRVRNLRLYVRAHACEGGHMQAPIPTSHHTHTHMLGAHASFHLIPMFSWSSSGETLISVHTRFVYPLDVPLSGVARRSSLLFCVCLGHRVM